MNENNPQVNLELPSNLVIKRTKDELEFVFPFEPGSKIGLWILVMGINSFALIMFINGIVHQYVELYLMSLLHLFLGIYLAFYARAASYNLVRIKVNKEKIEKQEGPYYLPFHKMHYAKNWSEIIKIYVDQIEHKGVKYDRFYVKSYYEKDRLLKMKADNIHLKLVMIEIKNFLSETD